MLYINTLYLLLVFIIILYIDLILFHYTIPYTTTYDMQTHYIYIRARVRAAQ